MSRACVAPRVALAAFLASAAPAQDLFDLRLQLRDGELWYGERDAFGERAGWAPMFGGLWLPRDGEEVALVPTMAELGPIALLPLLHTGPGGAMANAPAERLLQKLDRALERARGIDWSGTERSDTRPTLVPPDPALDLLRVGVLSTCDDWHADWELARASRASADPFVRAAAQAELARRDAVPGRESLFTREIEPPTRSVSPAIQAGLHRLPAAADLVLGASASALPSLSPLLGAWQRVQTREAAGWHDIGSSLHFAEQQQLRIDRLQFLAFELANRCGNWRVDAAVAALQRGDSDRWWVHLGGVFQPEQIRAAAEAEGLPVHEEDDGAVAVALPGWRLRATAAALELSQAGYDVSDRGTLVPELAALMAADAPPVWGRVRIGHGYVTFAAELQRQPTPAIAVRASGAASAVAELHARVEAWRAARAPVPEATIGEGTVRWGDLATKANGILEREKCLWAATEWMGRFVSSAEPAGVTWRLDLSEMTAEDLARCLDWRSIRALVEQQ